MKILIPIVCSLAFWGCSPAGRIDDARPADKASSSKSPEVRPIIHANPAPANPNDKRKLLVAFGDSLTAGHGVAPGMSYPDFLQKLIDENHLPWRVVNEGVSGDTSTDGLNRINDVLDLRPQIAIVEFGGNDGLRGLPLMTTEVNLQQILQRLVRGGSRVVLAGMTLPPNYGPDYIHDFENIYKDLAGDFSTPLIPFLLEGVATPGDMHLMQSDGIHPTADGNKIVAATVFKYAEPLMTPAKN